MTLETNYKEERPEKGLIQRTAGAGSTGQNSGTSNQQPYRTGQRYSSLEDHARTVAAASGVSSGVSVMSNRALRYSTEDPLIQYTHYVKGRFLKGVNC